MTGSTVMFLHALGSSAREWEQVIALLPDCTCVALDLPGFGTAASAGYADVATMVDWLADEIRARALTSCILVGHSMGGKIVTLVAARAAAGEIGLAGVAGVVLVAASPPAPEPMEEDRRETMIGWFRDGRIARENAACFVDANTAERLPDSLREGAIDDVLRTSRTAWLGWLERGSREDWTVKAGTLSIPALIIAGAEDGDLDADAQRRLNQPHYATASLEVVPGAAHLIPYEQPELLARLIDRHVKSVGGTALPGDFAHLLNSERVSRGTRAAMLERTRPVPHRVPGWTDQEMATITALVRQVLPDCGDATDLARRIAADLAAGQGDGWRFALLPRDGDAWKRGIATLDALTGDFAALVSKAQAALLERMFDGDAGVADDSSLLSPEQMTLWFEDVRAATVRVWMALPATMAAIGYDGFASGGDGPRKQGYSRTAADDPEAWQQPRQQPTGPSS